MNYNSLAFEDFSRHSSLTFNLVDKLDDLNRRVAREAVDAIRKAGEQDRRILMILPVGPLDYTYWADLCNRERVSCRPLVGTSMDEYLDENDDYIPRDHPLSFRNYITETLVKKLDPELRPEPDNIRFPDPREPGKTTEFVESFGGADLCYGGFGITGHFAFNDPPRGDESGVEELRQSRTRCLTITRESQTQMCMGGTHGNWDIIPPRAVTLGMYELLMSKKIHLTFMRSWHAGVLRRALFGPVTAECPGSLLQEHPHVEVTLTRLAAARPVINVTQDAGEEEE